MKLMLDYTQRINLHAIMGAQRVNVDETRLWWRLQDTIELSDEERRMINYRMGKIGEYETPMWDNPNPPHPLHEYEFTEDEFKKIAKIVKEWQPGFLAGNDRRWLEPLLKQLNLLDSKVNGNASLEAPVPAGYRA